MRNSLNSVKKKLDVPALLSKEKVRNLTQFLGVQHANMKGVQFVEVVYNISSMDKFSFQKKRLT